MADHLAALFATTEGGGRGAYVPGRYDLWLHGADASTDRLIHHHEAQHVILNSASAWGAALHAAAAMPGWQPLFGRLLDRCRTTHESFATYLGRDAAEAETVFGEYAPLLHALNEFVEPFEGSQRRALAVTALAQACMQTPILDQMLAAWPESLSLGVPLRIDQPDERFALLCRSPGLAATAAADASWALWEDTVFQHFAEELRRAGATVLDGNDGHLAAAAELFARVAGVVPGSRLAVDATPGADRRLIGMVLNHARLWLHGRRRPGRFITVGADVDPAEVVRVAEATSQIGGRPSLVISARLPGRLLAGYDYPDDGAAALEDRREPVVGVRSPAGDGDGGDAVWWAELPTTAEAEALVTAWDGRGDLTFCVAASCLPHPAWRSAWLPVMRSAGPLVWLIDVGVSALAGEFGRGPVHGVYLDLGRAPAGARKGVAFKVDGVAGTWVAVADELGIQLITQQVDELGADLRMTGRDWSADLPALQLVLIELLHAESYLDLRGRIDGTPA
ncbi:hypothetical protein [Actinoplanes sp. NPDC048796]|uniref:hypothetical protein n=1 Tax=Actinoplanes sp. NPDC048796 TaxID=3155640 RepID=UPI0033F7A5B7